MADDPTTAERAVHTEEPAEGGDRQVDEALTTRGDPAQADAEDPTLGGTSDGDTAP